MLPITTSLGAVHGIVPSHGTVFHWFVIPTAYLYEFVPAMNCASQVEAVFAVTADTHTVALDIKDKVDALMADMQARTVYVVSASVDVCWQSDMQPMP